MIAHCRLRGVRLLGAIAAVVVLAAGCGTAAASNGATAARASASPSGATKIAPACTCGGTPGGAAQGSAHVGNLDIDSGYAVSSVVSLEGTTTVAYMTIANSGLKPVGLIGAATPRATSVRLNDGSGSGSNTEAITAVDSVPIAAGAAVALAPGSYHLTVVGLSAPLRIGDTLPLTLRFSGGTTVHITLPVEAR